MKLLNGFLDFFVPRICPGCETKLEPEEKVVCPNCFSKLNIIEEPTLKKEYNRKFRFDQTISDFKSLFLFNRDSISQNLIHELKYKQQFRIGLFLGRLLYTEFEDVLDDWQADFIVPIPLHQLKKAERGFNQSFYIAKGLGKSINIPVKQKLVKRVKYTQSQTKLGIEERKANMDGVFKITKPRIVESKNIIILDDVITSGSTVNECAKVLKSCGAGDIYALSVALADKS